MTGTTRAGTAAQRIALASLLARRDGYLEARVEGRSMGATLPEGSFIRIRPGRDRELTPGDVIAIAANEKIVVHRVLKVREAAWKPVAQDEKTASVLLLTRGDGEILPDPPVPAAWVIGPVIEVRIGEGPWGPIGSTMRKPFLRAIPAAAAGRLAGTLLALNPGIADRAARAMLFCAYLSRFILTGGREGRLEWPGRS